MKNKTLRRLITVTLIALSANSHATTTDKLSDYYLDIRLNGINTSAQLNSVSAIKSAISAGSITVSIGNASSNGGTPPSGPGIVDAQIDGERDRVLLGSTTSAPTAFNGAYYAPNLVASEFIFGQAPNSLTVLEPSAGFATTTISPGKPLTISMSSFSSQATGTSFDTLGGPLPFIYLPDHSIIGLCYYTADSTNYQLYLCRFDSNARSPLYRPTYAATNTYLAPSTNVGKITFAQGDLPLTQNPIYFLGY